MRPSTTFGTVSSVPGRVKVFTEISPVDRSGGAARRF
jgi:hypothetical protein